MTHIVLRWYVDTVPSLYGFLVGAYRIPDSYDAGPAKLCIALGRWTVRIYRMEISRLERDRRRTRDRLDSGLPA